MVNATVGSPNDFQIVIRYEFEQQNMNHISFEAILFLFSFFAVLERKGDTKTGRERSVHERFKR